MLVGVKILDEKLRVDVGTGDSVWEEKLRVGTVLCVGEGVIPGDTGIRN